MGSTLIFQPFFVAIVYGFPIALLFYEAIGLYFESQKTCSCFCHVHEVVVNRQLCIANAFEEVIQEKTPRFHRAIRSFYDKYGFPVAKLIKHKWSADIVYILMKPLEWIFLIVLYFVDVHPENRITVQYMGKVPKYRH